MQVELFLLILSTLFFASILAGKAGSRFGVPALLLVCAACICSNGCKSRARPNGGKRTAKSNGVAATQGREEAGGKTLA